jgi:D-beta-D-heptose 7-phosphate kinase/D-beta-D-heptose 1-phosphate adenosyltransferase
MFDYDDALERVSGQTILCVGDLMLDDFLYGEVTRVSPEAPAPVLAVKREERIAGGGGNVARNITSLGARCVFIGVTGADEAARLVGDELARSDRIETRLVSDSSRPTTRKVRFVSEHYSTHLLRADWEMAGAVGRDIEDALIKHIVEVVPKAGALVLSDYGKGVLSKRVLRSAIDEARRRGLKIVVDPKGVDYSMYEGATVITPNRKELAEATRLPVSTVAEVGTAAALLRKQHGFEAVLVTLSEDGMLLQAAGSAIHVPAFPVRVRDVSGAGDTVAATMAMFLSLGADFEDAMRAANAAASVVVSKRGTAAVTLPELRARILPAAALAAEEKIVFDWTVADERVAEWRKQDLRIGFTNGCFDILHPGHVKVLAAARASCDRLIVGLNSDASVKRLKGESRPVQDVHARADVLAALEAVDLVIVFEEDTPQKLIERVQPKVLVKGGDYRPEDVVGREVVERNGGEVVLIDLVPGHSTTSIVRRSARSNSSPAKAQSA